MIKIVVNRKRRKGKGRKEERMSGIGLAEDKQ